MTAAQPEFDASKASVAARETFLKTLVACATSPVVASNNTRRRSRSLKRTKEAAQQFAIIARGLEGSSFGYATIVM